MIDSFNKTMFRVVFFCMRLSTIMLIGTQITNDCFTKQKQTNAPMSCPKYIIRHNFDD